MWIFTLAQTLLGYILLAKFGHEWFLYLSIFCLPPGYRKSGSVVQGVLNILCLMFSLRNMWGYIYIYTHTHTYTLLSFLFYLPCRLQQNRLHANYKKWKVSIFISWNLWATWYLWENTYFLKICCFRCLDNLSSLRVLENSLLKIVEN